MKIPEGSANVGAYYGNEENGQWQPNGVIIDSGVGGGVVGSGDAGVHRPVYPVHIPRAHMPAGYVMAGAYYPPGAYQPVPAPAPDDFADYMWMENEEEFDKQVMQQLEEEALMEQCIEAMLEDEQRERARPHNGHRHNNSNGAPSLSLEEAVSRSTLNPLAAEFVPTRARIAPEERPSSPTEAPAESPAEQLPEVSTEQQDNTEEPVPPQTDPPEVSAADIQPEAQDKRPKDVKKDTKKPLKDSKPKPKPLAVKSETKVQPKKSDLKPVKSETKIEEKIEAPVEVVKPQPAPVEETPTSGFKPINYAAAAKANKPKPKPTTPTEKPQQPPIKTEKLKPTEKTEKKDKIKTDKPIVKTEKVNIQRKNSTK